MRKANVFTWALVTGTAAVSLMGQTQVDLQTQSKNVDFSNAISTKPAKVGTLLPAVCASGEVFFLSNAPPGQNLYGCTSTNTWTQQSSGAGSGTVTHATGSLNSASIMTGNGSADSRTPCTGCTLDGSGNEVLTGSLTTSAGSTTAGTVSLLNGAELGAFTTNSFSLEAPASIPSSYRWKLPAADAAGLLASDGAGTPGTLSVKTVQGSGATILSAGAIAGIGTPLCTDASGAASTAGCSAGSGAVSTPLDFTMIQFVEEFYASNSTQIIGNFPFAFYNIFGTGSSFSGTILSPVGHPGVVQIKTSTATGDATGIRISDPNNGPDNIFHLGTSGDFTAWEFNIIFRSDTNSVAASGFFAGFAEAAAGAYGYSATDGIAVFYDTASHVCTSGTSSTTNVVYMVRSAGSDTCVDSTVPVAANTWYRLRIASTTLGQVIFQLATNGGAYSAAQTLSTNVPTAALNPTFQVITRQAGAHTLDIDRWAVNASGVAR